MREAIRQSKNRLAQFNHLLVLVQLERGILYRSYQYIGCIQDLEWRVSDLVLFLDWDLLEIIDFVLDVPQLAIDVC
jgi:hypothetical protein